MISILTIKDIAKLAGVSYSTVSKALNDDPRIKLTTKRKVLQIAEKHGYQKNLLATQLVSGKSRIIGFVIDELTNPLFSLMAKELHMELKKRGYKMIAVMTSDGIDLFYQLRVDGCIVWDNSTGKRLEYLQAFTEMSIPSFVLGAEDNPNAPYIKIDRKEGICKAVEYLMVYGHRRIGFIGDSQEIKVQGYKEALHRNGLKFMSEDILPAYSAWEDGYLAMRNYQFTADSPTAFIGLNNMITKGAMRALFEKGLKVPEDISLIGYDNSPDMQYAEVAISTVGPSLEHLTAKAADLIVSLVQGERAQYPIVIETKLFERNSVAAPGIKRSV